MAGFGEQKKKKKSTPKGKAQLGGEGLLKTAVDHHTRGDLVSAEKAYRAAIKIGYMHPAIFSNLGVICKNSERTEEAINLYKKAIEVSPNNPTAHMNLGGIYQDLGQLDQALAATLKSIELNPDNPTAHINLGSIYKDLGQLDQALAATLKSIELNPDNPTAHINLGSIYKDLGQLDQALAATLKSIELNPDNPTAHINLGGIYQDLGQLDQALAATLKSLELKPDNPDAHMNLGGIYQDLGQLDQALAATLKSLELKPDNADAHINLGGIYKDLGQLDQALTAAKKSMELDAHNINCYSQLSSLHLKAKRPAEAKAVCEQGLRISSKDIYLQNNLNAALSQITPRWHITMMNDAYRNSCYAEAINKAVKPNDLVLDIGAGSGLLSMMAADAGASKVIACELVIPIANKAQAIARKNGFENKISIYGMKSTDIKIGKEMPQKADIIISEIFSSEMVGEGILQTLQDSRERLLKEGGIMIPEQAEIKFALIGTSPEVNYYTNPGINSCYSLEDFSEICPKKIPVQLTNKPNLLSEAEDAFHFDFRKPFAFKSKKSINVTVAKDGQCIGIIQWLRSNLFGDIAYENSPGEISNHWSSNIYLFQNPISVRQGQSIKVNALVDKDVLWFSYDGLDS